jgi:hypothetical protein
MTVPGRNLFPSPFADGSSFFPGAYFGNTPLERAIIDRARGSITRHSYGPPQINTDLQSLTGAVESAFVLIPRDALPKITADGTTPPGAYTRAFAFKDYPAVTMTGRPTAQEARRRAAAWVAVAALLEGEEKTAADKAKAEAEAEQAAAAARSKRLDELALEYFNDHHADLGVRKARVIEDTYKLEQQLAAADKATADAKDDACGCI